MEYSIVIGATGGLGKIACYELAQKGENLFLTARSQERLELLKLQLLDKYPNVKIECYKVDLQSQDSLRDLLLNFSSLNAKIKGIYFFNGVDTQKAFGKYDCAKITMQVRVNYESVILLTKFALENRSKELKILVTSSLCGVVPMPYFALYSSTKSALINFFTALRYEYIKKGVKITILAPGSVPTREDIIADIKKQGLQGKLSKQQPLKVIQKALSSLDKNKRLCIVGLYNKVVYFFSRVTPLGIQQKLIAKKFKNKEKDAF